MGTKSSATDLYNGHAKLSDALGLLEIKLSLNL
jgi:hypothetical protein